MLTKVDPETQYGYTSFREVSQEGADNIRVVVVDGGGSNRRVRSDLYNLRKTRRDKMVKKALLGLRICGIVFCLISFSVMAADKHKGWALDSFYWYKEFRYVCFFLVSQLLTQRKKYFLFYFFKNCLDLQPYNLDGCWNAC